MDSVEIIKLYGGYENLKILNNITANFEERKLNAIIGPNGSGKSTLIKYLIKELKDNDKSIFIMGKNTEEYTQIELAKIQSLVPQSTKQGYEFTVEELVEMGRYCHDDIDTNHQAIDKAIEIVGISNIRNKLITQISGGELQLSMLAKAISQDTEIILLDEPTNNLDPKHQLILMDLLTKLKQQNKTIIAVLHDLNAVLKYFDNAILLKKGEIYKSGTVSEVITEKNISEVYGIKAKIIPSRDQLPSIIYYSL